MINTLKLMGGVENPHSYWFSARLATSQICQGGEC